MLENNLKELGTMLVKAGNTIERQKEEIERLRRENQMLKEKNKNISMDAFKFSFVGDFNVLIYDPIIKKECIF